MKNTSIVWFSVLLSCVAIGWTQTAADSEAFTVARLKYGGGGDWYNDASMIPNLLNYFQAATGLRCAEQEGRVSLLDENLFDRPRAYLFYRPGGRPFAAISGGRRLSVCGR